MRTLTLGALCVVLCLAGAVGAWLTVPDTDVMLTWPPAGLAVAALFTWGRGVWPAVAVASLVTALWQPGHAGGVSGALPAAVIHALLDVAEVLIIGLAIARLGGGERLMTTLRGVVIMGVLVTAAAAFCASLGTAVTWLSGGLTHSPLSATVTTALAHAVSVLLVVPVTESLRRARAPERRRGLMLWMLGAAAAAPLAWLLATSLPSRHQVVFEATAFVVVALCSVCSSYPGGPLLTAVFGAVALAATAAGLGPFAGTGVDTLEAFWLPQVFVASLAYLGAMLAALLAERSSARSALASQDDDLRWFHEKRVVGQPGLVGEAYLRALAQHAAACFEAHVAVVGRLTPDGLCVSTIAAWAGGKPVDTMVYDLAGSPCGEVIAHGLRFYPRDLRAQFPDDPLLTELDAESYLGTPILGDNGQALGVLAVVDTQPMADLSEHKRSLLGVLASRAGAEMQRLDAEGALRASQRQYRDLVEKASAIIIRWSPDGAITFANQFALSFFGYTETELLGQPLVGTIIPPVDSEGADLARMLSAIVDQPDRYATNQNENVRRDGSRAWVAWSNVAIRDEDGKAAELLSVGFDMSALRAAEAELRASADRVRATLDRSPFGAVVYELRSDGQLIVVGHNDSANRMLAADLSQLHGLTIEQAFPPLATTHLPEVFRRLARDGGTYIDPDVPYEAQGTAGRYQVYAYQIAPMQMALMFQETSERDQIQARLYRRNRELSLLNRVIAMSSDEMDPTAVLRVACEELADVREMPYVAAAVLDERAMTLQFVAEHVPEGEPTLAPGRVPLEEMPRLAATMAVGQPLCAWNPEQVAGSMDEAVLALRRPACGVALPLVVEGDAIGCLFLGDTVARELPADAVALAWGVARQIASALARSRLTASRRHLTVAIEQTPDSIVVTDPQGYIQYVNPAFESITGYAAAEVLGRSTRILKSGVHDDDHYRGLWTTITAGRVWEGRLTNRKRDGSLYTESAVIAPVRDELGATINYIAVKRDITAELEREEHYRQAQKMESIGRLAGGIAHDFNNILTAMIGHAETADEMLGELHPAREEIAGVLGASQRAASLTRQLLAFARRQVVQPVVFDLGARATGLASMLRRLIGEDIALRMEGSAEPLPVLADAGQMEQVLVNLTVNARDAMPNGGTLTIAASRRGGHALLSVTDTGTGIPDDVLPRIFDPFFTTKPEGQGTGLGLATCYGIVQTAGGDISCDSRLGHGTSFTIRLPLANGGADDAAAADAEIRCGTETIMMVEDEEPVRIITSRLLEGLGYNVLEADSGMSALARAAAYDGPIHLLISDMVMPEMNGLMLAEALARSRPETKLLLITGYIGDQAFQDPDAFASKPHLHKPFTRGELAEKVREVLD